jgi:uncharacterized protein
VPVSLSAEQVDFLVAVTDLARAGDADRLERCLEAGVPVNLTTAAGDSLLILAAYHRHAHVVELLLARAADVERINDHGQTALAAAVFRQDQRIVGALLDAGADPDTGSRSARMIADFFELKDMAALLPPPRKERPDALIP